MNAKREITSGNLWSIITTVVSALVTLGTILVVVALAYGDLRGADKLHDLRIDAVERQVAQRLTAQSETDKRLGTIEADIRVIRQILDPQGKSSR